MSCLNELNLAVAWSRIKIAEERRIWQSAIGRMNGEIYGILMELVFTCINNYKELFITR